MADIPRVGSVAWERLPIRTGTLPGRPHVFAPKDGELLRPAAAVAEHPAEQGRAGWSRRSSHSFSAAFLAQAAAQDDARPDILLESRRADAAYRSAAHLRVEILGMHLPLDLRV